MPVDIDAAVVANRRLSADYYVIAFDAAAIAERARPGQFVMIRPSRGLDPLLRRPFSIFEIVRDPSGRPAGISVFNKRVGVGTGLLADAEVGARLSVLGPLGKPFEPIGPSGEAWMIAGGVGLAPFATLAEALAARGVRSTLFYGARRAEELYCVDVFERLGVRVVLATEDGSRGARGRVTVPLEAALGEHAPRHVQLYVCGPTPMMSACARLAATYHRPCDVSLEQVMGCGLGGCYSCVVLARGSQGGAPHHTRTCVDGPVFDAERIVWESVAGH